MILFLLFLLISVFVVVIFLRLPPFGSLPRNHRAALVYQSPNWHDGSFQNKHLTPSLTEGASYYAVMKEFFLQKSKRVKPKDLIPSIKTDLHSLDSDKNVLVWFGHSSYFIQVDGRKILVDPVFSGAASPVKFTTRSFSGSDAYTTNDIPAIDFLFISHDHWDHLDYETVLALKTKVKKIITGLGTAAHLERWGFDTHQIIEKDWDETVILEDGFIVHTTPARHFSGRGLKRNQAIWTSFALLTPNHKIFLGGDSGYDTHFKEIGNAYGPFDIAILECGQYDKSWKYIHMMPEEVIQAANDLGTKKLLPVHWGKFALANHDWDTPIKTVLKLQQEIPILTPMIGEELNLDANQVFEQWWLTIE